MNRSNFDESARQYYRNLLFPIIREGIITGYNLYRERFTTDSPFTVTYFHSDLKIPSSRHLRELTDKLKDECDQRITERITDSVIARIAAYKVGEWEANPRNIKFFDVDGNEIPLKDIDYHEGIIIAEGRQYELNLRVENKKELRRLLKVMNRTVNFYEIDKYGKIRKSRGKPRL